MKDRRFRLLAILLALSLLGAACSKNENTEKTKKKTNGAEYEQHEMATKNEKNTDIGDPSQRDTSARATPTPTPEVIPILTEADIQSMNNNEALIVYNDEGNVSTIVGRFFYRPVKDEDDAINAVKGVQELLGLETGYFPFAVYGSRYQGYTYYTYQQMKGEITVSNATLKIVLDPEGYPCMLQSSLASNLDYTVAAPTITEKDAEDIVSTRFGSGYRVLSNYTMTTVYTGRGRALHCYQVYTENPNDDPSFDMPYMVHFISYDGEYIIGYPTAYLPTDPFADLGNDSYFKDMVPGNYTYTITLNGNQFEITIPVSYNSNDNKYYLCDPSRKIIVADYYEYCFNDNNLQFDCQDDTSSFNANHLLNYYYYLKAYDFYKEFDIESTDGFGMPILLLSGYCDENKQPIRNCCNMGVINGWSVFAANDGYSFGLSLDLVAHEYTHGVTFYARQGSQYYNEYGAINEAYSDIMGNICEMYMGETTDTTWLIGETSGDDCRSMSNPYLYRQPMYVGDEYYCSTSPLGQSSRFDDNGGVHSNNTLISHMCYYFYTNGESLEDLSRFFLTSIEMQTPNADYDDFYAIFVAAAKFSGHDELIPLITEYWQSACLTGSREKTAENTSVEGYERINIPFYSPEVGKYCVVQLFNEYGSLYLYTTMQWDGIATFLAPTQGAFTLGITEYTDASLSTVSREMWINHDLNAWTDNPYDVGIMSFESGDITTFPTYR